MLFLIILTEKLGTPQKAIDSSYTSHDLPLDMETPLDMILDMESNLYAIH